MCIYVTCRYYDYCTKDVAFGPPSKEYWCPTELGPNIEYATPVPVTQGLCPTNLYPPPNGCPKLYEPVSQIRSSTDFNPIDLCQIF